ncbi:NAD(+) diphosphatase [Rheinheimera muenzenbergensis]|uniref:NAD(+) diphosphatase n=1 Tax=Rheinheimera muenzenbergensis TaxID=1193628 RepID=A0ABU8C5S4_9GAMM|nr:NAD(+) diphosphatase [Gammaproteobacteria bacterium]MBU1555100.1 NAD(+) diphosphatase [Gammaproteobacteria bacterium]MBU2072535.1 NAD(+) diphosphatase [Gammaproteobacteria bacterium]MBU2184271.1 NAD(+) diphosphatase [Gammaproteobacteria bacterium]MBU2206675.1 NAD(+) diphosphatase [Gammaproteobacteria bacterium]
MIRHSISPAATQQGLWFVVSRGRIWLNATQQLPRCSYAELALSAMPEHICWLGQAEGLDAFLVINHDHIEHEQDWVSPRELLGHGECTFQLAARATQVALFLQTHRFCGQCGSAMQLVNWELAMLCNKCGHRCYPRIAPCVLVGIAHQGKILLARSSRHRQGFFSILAGFVESAETLEQAAIREVKEEVGVDITNLRYVGSQPWPFPHSLMTGFIADYVAGDIVCQPNEIEQAAWFSLDELPEVPPPETLSGQIIQRLQQSAGK